MQQRQHGQELQDPSRPPGCGTGTAVSCQSCSEIYHRLRILLFPPAPPRMTRIFAGRVRSSSAMRTFRRLDLLAKSQIVPVVQPQAGQARSGTDKLQDGQLGTASKERLSKAKLIKKVYVEDVEYRKPKRVPSKHCRRMRTHHPHANVSSPIMAHTCILRSLHKEPSQQTVSTRFKKSPFRTHG